MRALERVKTGAEDVRQLQDALQSFVRPLLSLQLLDGRLVEDVALVSGQANYVPHGLGRRAKWLAVSPNADARIWEDTATAAPVPTTQLVLRASANVTVHLWVF